MADKKISALTALAQGDVVVSTDVLPIVDTSATETKKIAVNALVGAAAAAGLTNVDINSGTIDGTTIATSDITVGSGKTLNVSAGTLTLADNQISGDKVEGGTINAITINTLTSTAVNATTVDATNVEVTNIKAKDGTAAATIADSTGSITFEQSPVIFETSNTERGRIVTSGGNFDFLAGSTTTPTISLASNVATFTNNPILSGGTANGVLYLNGSKVATSGSALQFSGTKLSLSAAGGADFVGLFTNTTAATPYILRVQEPATPTSGYPLLDVVNNAGSTAYLRVDSGTGNVGIGTSSPNYLMTMYKASLPILQIANSTSGSGASDGLLMYLNGANATLSNEESGYLRFQTAGTERAVIDSSGNLGIGTSSPKSLLTVARGNVTGAGQWASSAIALDNPTNVGSYSQISFGYTTSTTNAAAYIGFVSTNQAANGYGDLVFGTRSVSTDTQPTERARITSGGDLLVATTSTYSAYAKLHVANGLVTATNATDGGVYIGATTGGTEIGYLSIGRSYNLAASGDTVLSTSAAKPLIFGTNNTERARITSGGNFGVGLTDPNAPIEAQSDSGGTGIIIRGRATANSGTLRFYANNGTTQQAKFEANDSVVEVGSITNVPLVLYTNGAEKARITSGGQFLVGTTSTDTGISVDFQNLSASSNNVLVRAKNTTNNEDAGFVINGNASGTQREYIIGINTIVNSSDLTFSGPTGFQWYVNGTERARITSGGEFLVAKTSTDVATVGTIITTDGRVLATTGDADCMVCNRQNSDGTLMEFRHANTTEGTISVSGNTVSYNAFAGSHWSQLQDGSKPDILRGTVMESINELCVWPGEQNERLPKSKISDTAGSKKVYGVFMAWDNDWTETNDMYVTAVGAFICRVNGSVTVQEGDLLESNGDGTARVQADDIIRSSTIGKVTSTVKTHQYDDGSYCVPTVLYCG